MINQYKESNFEIYDDCTLRNTIVKNKIEQYRIKKGLDDLNLKTLYFINLIGNVNHNNLYYFSLFEKSIHIDNYIKFIEDNNERLDSNFYFIINLLLIFKYEISNI